jgi:predicted ATPase
MQERSRIRRIAVSGGPGAGKTTLWQTLRALHKERVVAVPEVATLLFTHVFPQVQSDPERRAVQSAIFAVQRSLELTYEARLEPGQILLCDRGVPDGGGYWPEGPADFFRSMATDWQAELARYEAVLFMESAAVGGLCITAVNPTRTEYLATACLLDGCLRSVWQPHPRFFHIGHELDFAAKLARACSVAEELLLGAG